MSAEATRRYIIAYDIPDDRRRSRLAKRLLSYRDRLQYSVFVADCRPAKLIRLRAIIESTVVAAEDSVLLCDLGPAASVDASRFSFIGLDRPLTPSDTIVI